MIRLHVTHLVWHMRYTAAKRMSHHPRRWLRGCRHGDGVAACLGCHPVAGCGAWARRGNCGWWHTNHKRTWMECHQRQKNRSGELVHPAVGVGPEAVLDAEQFLA